MAAAYLQPKSQKERLDYMWAVTNNRQVERQSASDSWMATNEKACEWNAQRCGELLGNLQRNMLSLAALKARDGLTVNTGQLRELLLRPTRS